MMQIIRKVAMFTVVIMCLLALVIGLAKVIGEFILSGQQIAYVAIPGYTFEQALYLRDVDRNIEHRVTLLPFALSYLWSSDGKQVIFYRQDSSHFYVVDIETGTMTVPLASDAITQVLPSPNGHFLLYLLVMNWFIRDVNSNQDTALYFFETPTDRSERPAWSPDSHAIAFVSNLKPSIWIKGVDGTASQFTVVDKDDRIGNLTWSPDGTKLAFTASHPMGDELSTRIYVLDRRGNEMVMLGNFRLETWFADFDWSLDSRNITFASRHNGILEIHTLNVTSKKVVHLAGSGQDVRMPKWSPDGSQIAFLSCSGICNLDIMSTDGKNRRQLTSNNLVEVVTFAWLFYP